MRKSGFVCIRYLILLVCILSAMVLSACFPVPQTTQSAPLRNAGSGDTPSPAPDPSPTPTRDPNKSRYFENVGLLETTNIPLMPGDEDYTIRSSVIGDMDADGVVDAVFTLATYPENIAHPIVVLNGDGPVRNLADRVFPAGVPAIVHSNQIFFTDINNDELDDLLISEAGNDHPPWYNPDALVGIAFNRGGGIFEDVSAMVPEAAKGLRNYPLAAGDLYNDGVVRILLPSQEAPITRGPEKSGLLSWNGSEFEYQQNWIDMSLWWYPENLYAASFMAIRDIDADGWQDLYLSGSWTTPNHRILYGSADFPSVDQLVSLPEGPYGHTTWEHFQSPEVDYAQGADVNRVVFEDFDRDGDLDLVSIMEDVQLYKPGVFNDLNHPWYSDVSQNGGTIYANVWLQVLRNDGNRQFTDVTSQGRDAGYRYYISLLPMDLDLDGDIDLLGQYWSKEYGEACVPQWGSTFFINQGDLVFHTVEAIDVFPELSSKGVPVPWESDCDSLGLGVLFPTVITPEGIKGFFVYPIDFEPDHPELRVLRFQTTGRFHIPE
jgi:hypothetical protein